MSDDDRIELTPKGVCQAILKDTRLANRLMRALRSHAQMQGPDARELPLIVFPAEGEPYFCVGEDDAQTSPEGGGA